MNIRPQFCHRLKQLRLEAGLSQEVLACRLGMTRSCLANYESGKRQPDHATLICIADYFHVLTDYLICRTDCRSLILDSEQAGEFMRLHVYLKRRGKTLDLSVLTGQNRDMLLHYCLYMKQKKKTDISTPAQQATP